MVTEIEKLPQFPQILEIYQKGKELSTYQLWKQVAELLKVDLNKTCLKIHFWKWVGQMEDKNIAQEVLKSPPPIEETEKEIRLARAIAVKLFLRELKLIQKFPRKMTGKSIDKLTRLYATIRSETEAAKRTKIARGKLKLEAVRTLLPYQRILELPLEEIKKLKENVNASFNRLLQLKSGREDG